MSGDDITGIAAIIIAVFALIVSVWQGYISRKHNELSVTPILHFISGALQQKADKNTTEYKISITNNGIGPCIIDSIEVFYKNELVSVEKYNIHYSALLLVAVDMATYKESVQFDITSSMIAKETVILPNNLTELLSVKFYETHIIKRENIITNLYDIDIRITYTSIYKTEKKTITLIQKQDVARPPFIPSNVNKLREKYPENVDIKLH